jgi:hypothetical protein
MRVRAVWPLAWLACVAVAAAQPVPHAGAGLATRSVSRYLAKERALEAALVQRDRAAVERVVAGDFVARGAASPDGDDREAWLSRELATAHGERIVRDLDVREIDDLAVASFLLDARPARGRAARPLFVVDVWRASSGQLLARHTARAADAPPAPSRPSGRD